MQQMIHIKLRLFCEREHEPFRSQNKLLSLTKTTVLRHTVRRAEGGDAGGRRSAHHSQI